MAASLPSSCTGLTRLRGRNPFGEAKARASIIFEKWIAGSSPAMTSVGCSRPYRKRRDFRRPGCSLRCVRQPDRVRCRRRRPDHVFHGRHDRRRKFKILLGKPVHQHLQPKRQSRRFPGKDRVQPPADLVTDRAAMRAIDLQLVSGAHCRFRKNSCRNNKVQILSHRLRFIAHLNTARYEGLTVFWPLDMSARSLPTRNKNGGLSPAALFRWMPGSSPGMTIRISYPGTT